MAIPEKEDPYTKISEAVTILSDMIETAQDALIGISVLTDSTKQAEIATSALAFILERSFDLDKVRVQGEVLCRPAQRGTGR